MIDFQRVSPRRRRWGLLDNKIWPPVRIKIYHVNGFTTINRGLLVRAPGDSWSSSWIQVPPSSGTLLWHSLLGRLSAPPPPPPRGAARGGGEEEGLLMGAQAFVMEGEIVVVGGACLMLVAMVVEAVDVGCCCCCC